MSLVHQTGAAILLIVLTLCLQCAGLVVLITWLRALWQAVFTSWGHSTLPRWSCNPLLRLVALHGLQILLWAGGYHWLCQPSWESAFYFSASSYATVGYGDVGRWKASLAC
jgi:voltage-gated potassium channel